MQNSGSFKFLAASRDALKPLVKISYYIVFGCIWKGHPTFRHSSNLIVIGILHHSASFCAFHAALGMHAGDFTFCVDSAAQAAG